MKTTAILLSLCAGLAIGETACESTQTSVTPATAASPAVTNTTTTVKGLDPATVAQIDIVIQDIASNAPSAIADAQAISALVHGTNK